MVAKGKRGGRRHNWSAISTPWGQYRNGAAVWRYNCDPPPCRTLADMSEREILALELEYGAPVQRP